MGWIPFHRQELSKVHKVTARNSEIPRRTTRSFAQALPYKTMRNRDKYLKPLVKIKIDPHRTFQTLFFGVWDAWKLISTTMEVPVVRADFDGAKTAHL